MKRKFCIEIGLLVVVLTVAAVILFSGDGEDEKSPEEIAQAYIVAEISGNYQMLSKYSLYDFTGAPSIAKLQKEMGAQAKERLAAHYGEDWTVTAEITGTEDITYSELMTRQRIGVLSAKAGTGMDEGKVSAVKVVAANVVIAGSLSEHSQQYEVYMVEYDDKWKVFFRVSVD